MIGGRAVFEGHIWLLGGGVYETPSRPGGYLHYHDVWRSTDGAKWERHLKEAPWPARAYHDVAVFDDRLWVMEGSGRPRKGQGGLDRVTNDVWYSRDGTNWYELRHSPWTPRHAASVFVHDNALWMVAGDTSKSDVWKLSRG